MRENVYDCIREEVMRDDKNETSSFNDFEEEMARREIEERLHADLYTKGWRSDCDNCQQSFFGTEKYNECPSCENKNLHYTVVHIAVFVKEVY